MIDEKEIKKKIIQRLENIHGNKLNRIYEFLKKIDKENIKKRKILSYAGMWSDMDDATFDDFTENLKNRRKNRKNRF